MDLFDAVAKRHSYRGAFEKKSIPREHLQKIVQAGIRAPSGCNAQTTTFVIVDDPGKLATIAGIVDRPVVREAQAMIVCVVDHKPAYQDKSFAAEDCAAATENMLLAVTAMGYAAVWLDGVLRNEDKAGRIAELLGVPRHLEVRILLPLGIPKEGLAQKEKKPFADRAWFNRYGNG